MLTALALLFASALPDEAAQPYRVAVVVRFGGHREFTPAYRDRVCGELAAGLRNALGPLAADAGGRKGVEVVDATDLPADAQPGPWKDVLARGPAALDGVNRLAAFKTHFVFIDAADGDYVVRARQHDGFTGIASPAVRELRTPDRSLVGRLAGRLVGQDFGVTGTVEGAGPEVTVRLKGGAIADAPWDRWVRPGEVFAVVQLRGTQQLVPQRVAWTLIQATDPVKGGSFRGKLLTRYKDPLAAGPGVAGHRCLKLGTVAAPVRLRLVDKAGEPHALTTLEVRASDRGTPSTEGERDVLRFRDGLFQSERPLAHVAVARVANGATPVSAAIPVELLDDRVHSVTVDLKPGAEKEGELELEKRSVAGRLTGLLRMDDSRFREVSALSKKAAHAEARAKAEETLKALTDDMGYVSAEVNRLKEEAKSLGGRFTVRDLEAMSQDVGARGERLRRSIAALDEAIKKAKELENDPTRKEHEQLARQAVLAQEQADFEGALRLFEEALQKRETPEVRRRYDELKAAWELKGDAHRAARAFIYETFGTLETPGQIRDNLETLRKSLQACRQAGDRLTPLKVILTVPTLTERLEKAPMAEPEDAKVVQEASEGLLKATEEAKALIRR